MAFYFYSVPDLRDAAVFVDEEGAANDAFEAAAHEFLHAPLAVGLDHFVIGVAEEREVQFLLGFEIDEGFDGIGAHAEDDRRLVWRILVGGRGSRRPRWCSRGCWLLGRSRGRLVCL